MTTTEAVAVSKKYLGDLLPDYAEADVMLEEAEVQPTSNSWKFTFTATLPLSTTASLSELLRSRRISKVVEIDPSNGALLSLKNPAE